MVIFLRKGYEKGPYFFSRCIIDHVFLSVGVLSEIEWIVPDKKRSLPILITECFFCLEKNLEFQLARTPKYLLKNMSENPVIIHKQ